MLDWSIFRAFDVRGTYPHQMGEEVAYRIGRGLARVLSDLQDTPVSELSVAVGRDMRLSARGHGRAVCAWARRRGR